MDLTLGVSRPGWKASSRRSDDAPDLLFGERVPKAGVFVPNGLPRAEIAQVFGHGVRHSDQVSQGRR
jgi:hypothetical protein